MPEFTKPGAASVPRHLADFVVTEYGVASLMGKTERERAKQLISIAHPDHRADLKAEADKALGIGRSIFLIDGWPASSSTVDA